MEYESLKEKYKLNGLNDYKLYTLEDVLNVHGINPLEVEGYSTLTDDNKSIYKRFIINFLNSWDLEARATIKPLSFNDVEEVEYIGREDPDDIDYVKILLHEIYVIENDGSKELVKRFESKEEKIKITETIRNRYLRFEYELYGKDGWLHIISDEDWY